MNMAVLKTALMFKRQNYYSTNVELLHLLFLPKFLSLN